MGRTISITSAGKKLLFVVLLYGGMIVSEAIK